ncbi:MAG: phospholipid carrier-dependent glycosyltransferase [Chthoniobacteraceae bacterium]
MTRLQASLLVLVLWAGIYLPGLGSTELKGEEGRRILPAITMLETGNWLVPYVGGKPFLRKPPLVNWAIAVAFKLTGVRNEWTARMPSALCVLALALTIVGTSGRGWMNAETALVAAVMAMTQSGLLAKARFAGAEIEGIYAPLSGIAIVCWLAWWWRGKSPWLVWVVPGIFLGLASLAKGPSFHLLFFYAIVLTVLGFAKRWRDLLHPAQFAGLAVCAGLFVAWAIPYFKTPEAKDAAAVWKRQGIDRFTDSEFNAGNYFLNFPRGLSDQLPWLIFTPVLVTSLRRKRDGADEASAEGDSAAPSVSRALAWATGSCFFVVLLIPGALPRYVLPLGAPIAVLFAIALAGMADGSRVLRRWHLANRILAVVLILACVAAPFVVSASQPEPGGVAPIRAALLCSPLLALAAFVLARRAISLRIGGLVAASGAIFAIGASLYAIAAVPWINARDDLRPVAAAIDAAIPPGERLIIHDPGYFAPIFYLRTPYRYALSRDEIPPGAPWVLARGKERRSFAEKRPDLVVAQAIKARDGSELLLLQGRPETQKLPPR